MTIGNSVNTIGRSAFAYTSGLFSINIPGNVQTIEECAFYESALREVLAEMVREHRDKEVLVDSLRALTAILL